MSMEEKFTPKTLAEFYSKAPSEDAVPLCRGESAKCGPDLNSPISAWSWPQEKQAVDLSCCAGSDINRRLVEFMYEAVKHCWMGKNWTPQRILEKSIELGLMVKQSECIYGYSDEIKALRGE